MLTFEYQRGLTLDLSTGSGRPRALALYIHGGGFKYGSSKDRLAAHFAPLLVERDIAFASINYHKGGRPLRGFPPESRDVVIQAAARSAEFYPEVRPELFGPLLYRAVQNLAAAVGFLQSGSGDPSLSGLPIALIGMSAGGLTALGYCYGLDGLDIAPAPPLVTFALSSLPPQPWRISPDAPPSMLLTSVDDDVFPLSAVKRAEARLQQSDMPVVFCQLPKGRHNGPLREFLRPGDDMDWSEFVVSTIDAELPSGR